jgi:hypothetical protein
VFNSSFFERNIFLYYNLYIKLFLITNANPTNEENKNIGLPNKLRIIWKQFLLKDHPLEVKISIDVVSSTRHPRTMWGYSSSFCSNTRKQIQWVPKKMTCIEVTTRVLLKTMSFILNQITHHKADTTTKILYISFLLIHLYMISNIVAPHAVYTELHR